MLEIELFFFGTKQCSKVESAFFLAPALSYQAYYRKRGSASYIVREVLSVRERERERERESYREREKERERERER